MASEQIHVLTEPRAAQHSASAAAEADSDRVQTLRGIACMLLVAYHVIGDDATRGMAVDPDSAYRTFGNIIIDLLMPLFTFFSGFVYAYRPVQGAGAGSFARKKLQRLLIPLIVVSTLYFVVQALTPGTNTKVAWSQIWRIYIFPYNHFWFLQAIILIFAATVLLEWWGLLRTFKRYLIAMGCMLLIHFLPTPDPNIFSIGQALYLAPFFLAGLGANRFRAELWDRRLQLSMLAIFTLTFTLHVLACAHVLGTPPAHERTLLGTALRMSGIFTLMYWTPVNRLLMWIGGFSFTIYLYHVFFAAGVRITLARLGIHNSLLVFTLGCALGVIGPILFELAVKRSPVARRALLGQS